MDRFIFLDIDGPINTGRNDYLDPDRYGHHFDDMAVQNLRKIVEETGAKVVVSSSWRHIGLDRIRGIWSDWGLPGEIVGCTPGLWEDGRFLITRGEEIQKWLEENATDDYAYVILDDMDDSEATGDQKKLWIQINPHTGISKEDASRAVEILNNKDNKMIHQKPIIETNPAERKKNTIEEIESLTWELSAFLKAGSDPKSLVKGRLKVNRKLNIRERCVLINELIHGRKAIWQIRREAFLLENTCPVCGRPLYVLHTRTPYRSWRHLGGHEGYSLFCPHCKKDIDFYLTARN